MSNSGSILQWLRWPILPFATFAGAQLGAGLIMLLEWAGMKLRGGAEEDGWMFIYVLPVVSQFVFGVIFVHIACAVAPWGKVNAGIVMTTVLVLAGLFLMLVACFSPAYTLAESVHTIVQVLAALVAAVGTITQIHNEERAAAAPVSSPR